jgi:hypothetical protein
LPEGRVELAQLVHLELWLAHHLAVYHESGGGDRGEGGYLHVHGEVPVVGTGLYKK